MAKVFKIMVPDNSLISRTLYIESLSTELYVIDRTDEKFVSEHSDDLSKPALYILANRDSKKLYIGKTGDSLGRLRNHKAKDFWTEAIVFHSNPGTDTLSTTEVEWLEAKTYDTIKELGYYDLSENKQKPKYPTLKRDQKINCPEYFEMAKNYVCAAGFDFFLKNKTEEDKLLPDEPVKNQAIEHNIWLLPSKRKRFDLEGCFDTFGEVYWTMTNNFKQMKKGDTGYVYSSEPDKAIIFSFIILDCDLPYSPEMDRDNQFSKLPVDMKKRVNSKFAHIKLSGKIPNDVLTLDILKNHSMNGAPQSAMVLSQEKYKDLLDYIINNFKPQEQKPQNLIHCSLNRNSDAYGLFNPNTEVLIVLKDSKINPNHLPNLKGSALEKRNSMINNFAKKDGDYLILKQDVSFDSPSGAAKFCIGGAADGWISWIDEEGRPINVYRK